jgi:hypothetical protein
MKQLSFYLIALLFIPGHHVFGQVSIKPDNTTPHPSAMLDVQATDRGMLIPRMTQVQRIAIGTPAPGLMVYQTNGMPGFYYFDGTGWIRVGEHSGHYIGESFGGGVVYYLDETGMHGLIVSNEDLSAAQPWSNVTNVLIGPTAQSPWNGPGNSLAIVNQAQHTTSAAQLCLNYVNADYGTGIFTDWYLPSTGEARHLSNNIYQVQKALETDGNPITNPISGGFYWTSVEESDTTAWGCGIISGGLPGYSWNHDVKSESMFVRAVRAF